MHGDGIYEKAADPMNVLVVTVMVQMTDCLPLDVSTMLVNQISRRLTMSFAR